MNNLTELKSLLSQSGILSFHTLDENDIDEMLDRRDDAEFEEDWLRVFQKLEGKLFSDNALTEIKYIRLPWYRSISNTTTKQ